MKKKLLMAMFTLIATCSYGQLYRYTYDAAGNRTVRKYSLNGMFLMNENNESEEEVQLSKMLQEHEINISTTEEEINIRVSNLNQETKAEAAVYNVSGIEVTKVAIKEEETKIDLSKQNTGVYVTRVTINGNSTEWKVVKR